MGVPGFNPQHVAPQFTDLILGQEIKSSSMVRFSVDLTGKFYLVFVHYGLQLGIAQRTELVNRGITVPHEKLEGALGCSSVVHCVSRMSEIEVLGITQSPSSLKLGCAVMTFTVQTDTM